MQEGTKMIRVYFAYADRSIENRFTFMTREDNILADDENVELQNASGPWPGLGIPEMRTSGGERSTEQYSPGTKVTIGQSESGRKHKLTLRPHPTYVVDAVKIISLQEYEELMKAYNGQKSNYESKIRQIQEEMKAQLQQRIADLGGSPSLEKLTREMLLKQNKIHS